MKVIKHLKYQSPSERLRKFFKEIPIVTKILIPLITIVTLLGIIIYKVDKYRPALSVFSLLNLISVPELIIVSLFAITDFNREERNGSFFFLFSFLIKSSIIGLLCFLIDLFFIQTLQLSFMQQIGTTPWPTIFLLSISFRDMMAEPNAPRYLFVEPFQLKALFYPLFIVIILELIKFRVDIVYVFVFTFLIKVLKIDNLLRFISYKVDNMLLSQRMIEIGFISTGISELKGPELNNVVTSNSIVLEEK